MLLAHAILEAYSVLTRLPSALAVAPALAVCALMERFADEPLRLTGPGRQDLLETLATAGVFGGASYDGLVALEAKAHGQVLLTLDERAQPTYERFGAQFRVISA